MTTLYHYRMCGLDNIWLENGFHLEDSAYGPTVRIDDPEVLDFAIAQMLLRQPGVLSNKELRFLRQYIGLSQGDLGALVGVDAQTVARWEKSEEFVDSPATRLARLFFVAHLSGDETVCHAVANLKLMDRVLRERIVFAEHDGDWLPSMDEHCPT